MHEEQVEDHLGSCQPFAYRHPQFGGTEVDVGGIVGHSIDTHAVGYVECALVVPLLRYDGEIVLPEDPLGTHHRVVGAEPDIVEHNATIGNTGLHQRLPHIFRLVVALAAVVATHQHFAHLADMIQLCAGGDTVIEIGVGVARAAKPCGAK